MSKNLHEIRDPIHVFVRLDGDERKVLNSRPFQRLRYIHQLATTYLIYPGATHRRFEHSLGVMELAGRVFDVVTNPENVTDEIKEFLTDITNEDKRRYWRRVLRMSALCHDLGHLPFSHAAEDKLLPKDWDHERITREIIQSELMKSIWDDLTPHLLPDHIEKIAVGKKKARDLEFTPWEEILSEIIVGDSFGVDRIDYLLRDSHHAGVAYGKFDHHRLIDTLRILPVPADSEQPSANVPALGIEAGGLESAEALLLARYFMYSQLYFHPIRRIYDIHLKDFLVSWLSEGAFSTEVEKHLETTDNEVTAAFHKAAFDSEMIGHDPARRLVLREHFKLLYERNPNDVNVNPESGETIAQAAKEKFGDANIRHDRYSQKDSSIDFPVKAGDGRVLSSTTASNVLKHVPLISTDYVFVNPEFSDKARKWLHQNREDVIRIPEEDENG